jgi:hypothetical protein
LTTAPVLATTATAASSVAGGPYAITASGAVDTNYTIGYTSGLLTVNPVTLTITANSLSKAYGAALPTLTASYSGFVNGDTTSSLTTAPVLATTATAASSVAGGPYTITALGAVDTNYTIGYTSGLLTVNPATLTITANSVSKNYGAALPTLTASYSGFVNGDTSTSLTTAPILATTATASSPVVGSYTTTAFGAVDSNYTIGYVAGILTINPVALNITANSLSKSYGAALPTLTASYSGFVNGDTATSLTTAPTITTNALASSPVVGSYATTASGAVDSNYTISYTAGALTINPVTLTITANSVGKNYGAALPTLTATYTGFVNGDTATSLTTAPSLATTATASSPVAGSYAITAFGAVDANYTIGYVAGTLTINPVALTITANSLSKNYGAALPALTASYSGFVNGDTATSLTTAPVLVTNATAASPVIGTYTTSASGAVDSNYTISYATGLLTINPVTLTITANSLSKNYGAALPTLTASYSGFVNGDTAVELDGQADARVTLATAASPVLGTYTTTASGAVDANYTIGYVAGSLTINPVALTITANSVSKAYGAALPTLTASYSGFVNGDTSTSLTTAPVLATNATAASPVLGTYTTTASGAVDANYTIGYVAGTLTINPAALTITANNLSPRPTARRCRR